MAFAMPSLPAFSLRVQLFAPTAYGPEDKPVRNFRVVIDPESTIQQFCQEASRIHEINYGQPIAIKRCQDDQGFDITQTEVVGSLFSSANTIRVIQASSFPNIRDSVPPTSALRFDPSSLLGKRNRAEASPKTNGVILPPNSYKPNKRQRVADLDPDQPLASLEEESAESNAQIVPNSQESVILGNHSFGSSSRPVRPDFLRVHIRGTPSPPPSVKSESSTDTFSFKLADKRSNLPSEIHESSSARGEQQRSKSKSLAANGSKERAVSAVRNSASPALGEGAIFTNGFTSSSHRSRRVNGNAPPATEESIYDQIVSGDEGAAILKVKKAALKRSLNSPAKGQFNTPPTIKNRSRENSTPQELALTPQSAKQQQRQKEEAHEAKKARLAAAEAAEQRKREAEEAREAEQRERETEQARQAEEARRAEEERVEREELARIAAENLKRDEAERLAKEQAAREAERQRIAKEKKEVEKLAREKAEEETNLRRMASSPPEVSRGRQTSSPLVPRAGSSTRVQSSTPFIPTGRKSSLKISSLNGSSPAPRKLSSTGVGIDDNMPMPITKSPRRVSFVEGDKETPDRPPKSAFAKKPSTPHPAGSLNKSKRTSITPDTAASKVITPGSDVSKSRSTVVTPTVPASKVKGSSPAASKSRSISVTSDMAPPKVTTPNIVPSKTKTITPQMGSTKPQVILPGQSKAILPPARATILPPPRPAYIRTSSDRSFSPQVPLQTSREATPVKPSVVKKPIVSAVQKSTSVHPSSSAIPPPSSRATAQSELPATKPTVKKAESESEESSSGEEESEESESESEDEEVEMKAPPKLKSPALLAQDSPVKSTEIAESDDSGDSDEEDEAEVLPARRVLSPSPSPTKTNKEIEDQAELETQSFNSSVRDSRSPVRYNEHTQIPSQRDRLSSPEYEQTSRKDEEKDDSSSDEEDVEMPDIAVDATASEVSESENEDEDITIQVPKSSAPISSAIKDSPSISQEKITSTSKAFTSPIGSSSPDTQEEVDDQLISSLIEALPKSSSPASVADLKSRLNGHGHGNVSSPLRPSIGFGASLKGMNEKKKAFSSSAPAFNGKGGKAKTTSLMEKLEGAVDESDDEESDDDVESSEDEDDVVTAVKPFLTQQVVSKNYETSSSSDSESDSDSENGSGSQSESEDEVTKGQKELKAQIEAMKNQSMSQTPTQTQSSPLLRRGLMAAKRMAGGA